MQCPRCLCLVPIISDNILIMHLEKFDKIRQLNCTSCKKCVALTFNETWRTPEDILKVDYSEKNGWLKATSARDREVYFVLSQVIYHDIDIPDEEKKEVLFDHPDPTDIIMILWLNREAIGFYTLKLKGSLIEETMECYAMHTLDTAYIRSTHRRQQHGIGMLQNIISTYPGTDIGFSTPISSSMWKVLRKFLHQNTDCQDKFWEIEGAGDEGNRKLIWYAIKLQEKKKKAMSISK